MIQMILPVLASDVDMRPRADRGVASTGAPALGSPVQDKDQRLLVFRSAFLPETPMGKAVIGGYVYRGQRNSQIARPVADLTGKLFSLTQDSTSA